MSRIGNTQFITEEQRQFILLHSLFRMEREVSVILNDDMKFQMVLFENYFYPNPNQWEHKVTVELLPCFGFSYIKNIDIDRRDTNAD